ncbi:hypothetical protein C8J57DRAFT_1502985 [Mycena rebaudengoi]|nr:hypothetical protein C8J57DRAFT_1502985 [Mycena rebaudengoi]
MPPPTLTSVLVAGTGTEGEEPRVSFTPECEAGLAALNSALTDDSGDSALSDLDDSDVEATIPLRHDSVDVTLPFFRDLLTDKPVDGANKVTSLSNWSGPAIDSGGNGTRSGGKISWDGEAEKMYIYTLLIGWEILTGPYFPPLIGGPVGTGVFFEGIRRPAPGRLEVAPRPPTLRWALPAVLTLAAGAHCAVLLRGAELRQESHA